MPRPLRNFGVLAAAAVFLLAAPIAIPRANSYDGVRMEQVAAGITDHGTPIVRQVGDQFGLNTPYSVYGIGTSLVMTPLRELAKFTGLDAHRTMNVADALLVAATAFVVWLLLRRRNVPPPITMITTALIVFASPLLAYAITDFSEPGIALMVALGVLGLDGVTRHTRLSALGTGAAVGGAILFRADSLILIAVPFGIALLAISSRRVTDARDYVFGLFPFLAITGWYNAARFGSVFDGGYAHQGFTHPFWSGLYGLLLSPGRGIFIYAPILIIAIAIVPRLDGAERALGLLAIALLVLRALFYARWWSWYGGTVWGPRFFVPILPAFAPPLADALQHWGRRRWIEAIVATSAVMSLIGVWVTAHPDLNFYREVDIRAGTATQVMAQVTDPKYVHDTDHIMFDWSLFPFGRGSSPPSEKQ